MLKLDNAGLRLIGSEHGTCRLFEREEGTRWISRGELKLANVRAASWAPVEVCACLAVASGDAVTIFDDAGEGDLREAAVLRRGAATCVTDVAFAPARLGLVLAVAFDDGRVVVYSKSLAANTDDARRGASDGWEVVATLECYCGAGSASELRLAWDPSAANAGLVVCRAGAADRPQLWKRSWRQWRRASQLLAPRANICDMSFSPQGDDVEFKRVAFATMVAVEIHAFRNDDGDDDDSRSDAISVSVVPDAGAQTVEWNAAGTLLATGSGDGARIKIWKPDLVGKDWIQVAEHLGANPQALTQ
ncbi:hypothetical protein M885DRAFT_7681 [Pelagophyceae sp. CCMP2097]|nr:hypothetical protein M885DRAFT_7681 [Pelagophyceae sp. CCMP2097]